MAHDKNTGMDKWTPGIVPVKLSKDPLGTEGELTPGPDELNPQIPEERVELEERGYLPKPDPEIVGDEEGDSDDDPLFTPFAGSEPLFPEF